MLPDIADLYASYLDAHEQEEIPEWAPRSVMITSAADETFLTRIEKRLGRLLNYGEACQMLQAAKAEAPNKKPFIERVKRCLICHRYHASDINSYRICSDCIPF